MAGEVTDPRAHALRERYQALFPNGDLPVPVDAIAEDLLGLWVEEVDDLDCSGLLIPAERRIVLRADEPQSRKRFTLAHELGHWVCQVQEGHTAPVIVGQPISPTTLAARSSARRTCSRPSS